MKIKFFYGYCFAFGKILNYLIKNNNPNDFEMVLKQLQNYRDKNNKNTKKFILIDNDYLLLLSKTQTACANKN